MTKQLFMFFDLVTGQVELGHRAESETCSLIFFLVAIHFLLDNVNRI